MHQRVRVWSVLAAFLVAMLLWSGLAAAHIANEKTQFPDIAASAQADDIVLLVALNIVPQTPVFEPDKPFLLSDLAAWAALAHRKDPGGEGPDASKLIADGKAYLGDAASDLTGQATAANINQAIFDGKLTVDKPDQTFTKAEAAAFIASHLTPDFLKTLNDEAGPTGVISKVTTGKSADGDTAYTFTIDGKDYAVYDHARVIGPTDLTLWQGETVSRSYLAQEDDGPALVFIQEASGDAGAAQASGATSTSNTSGVNGTTNASNTASAQSAEQSQQAQTAQASASQSAYWIGGLVIILVVLGALLFVRRR